MEYNYHYGEMYYKPHNPTIEELYFLIQVFLHEYKSEEYSDEEALGWAVTIIQDIENAIVQSAANTDYVKDVLLDACN